MPNADIEDARSRRATAPPKPVAKPNQIRVQILGELVANKQGRLANNVSGHSVEILAKRWLP